MKNHDKRNNDPMGAKRLDKHQRITVCTKPKRPEWMTEQEFAELPNEIEIRLVDLIPSGFNHRTTRLPLEEVHDCNDHSPEESFHTRLDHECLSQPLAGGIGYQGNQMLPGHGYRSRKNTHDGADRNLVVLVS